MTQSANFYLVIPVNKVAIAKQFYSKGLDCIVERENENAVIFNF